MTSTNSSLFNCYDKDTFEQSVNTFSSRRNPRGGFKKRSFNSSRYISIEGDFKQKRNSFMNLEPCDERKMFQKPRGGFRNDSSSSSKDVKYDHFKLQENSFMNLEPCDERKMFQKPRGGFRNDSSSSSKDVKYDHFKLQENSLMKAKSCDERKQPFSEVYKNWFKSRLEAIKKLKTLLHELHDDQLGYNKAQLTCRQTGCLSRQVKSSVQPGSINFIASVAAFLSDASSGIVSVAQAVNIENYQTQFQEIVDQDAKMTKHLYEARSQSVAKYDGIEEVFRKFQSVTFDSTLSEVSNTLEVSKVLTAVEIAYRNNDLESVLRIMKNFVEKGSQSDILCDISRSIQKYASNNPSALDACKSAGRAAYGVFDALGLNKNRNVGRSMSNVSNSLLILLDKEDIAQLENTVVENVNPQSKLEENILEALDSLTSEMNEVRNAYLLQQNDAIGDNSVLDG